MPMATLKFPRSLTTQGKTFKKGVTEPISDDVAEILQNDARFEIKGLAGDLREDRARLAAGTESGRPHVRAVRLEQIRIANSTLDPDVTENYEVNGMPSIAGLAKAMGWTPDIHEIREALRIKRRSGELGSDGDSVAAVYETRAPVLAVSEASARFIDNAEIPQDAAEAYVPKEDLIAAPAGKGGIKLVTKPKPKIVQEVPVDIE